MSWYADLEKQTMVASGDHIRAIGWLSSSYPFQQGISSPAFLTRLREFVLLAGDSAAALYFPVFGGVHKCELCLNFWHGCNFGVPEGDVLYVAPGMIAHYVEQHGYVPPAEFVEAILNCPLPDSKEYAELAKPFSQLHEEDLEREHQKQIEFAGHWAAEQGGTEEMVQQAANRFFGHTQSDLCKSISRSMPTTPPSSTAQ